MSQKGKEVMEAIKADVKKTKKTVSIKLSTLAIIIVSLVAGFYAGMQFVNFQTNTINSRVTEIVKSLK